MATSAYQIEGAVREGGRGPSIWDTFSHAPGRTRQGDTGDVACDHYQRYLEDVALMADLGVTAYRFSVAWPRVQPDGSGPPNQAGLDFYRRLVNALGEHGIAAVPTLFHWDLPEALQDAGGWPSRETALRFADYASVVGEALGGSVEAWITVNEPWVAAWHGYGSGIHAPGHADEGEALSASHHLLLAHGLAATALRAADPAPVGIALNLYPVRAASEDPEDVRAVGAVDAFFNRLFLDPLFGRGYPPELLARLAPRADRSVLRDEDLATVAQPLDFLGVNYYTTQTVTSEPRPGHRTGEPLPASLGAGTVVDGDREVTAMGWPIEPEGLTEMLIRLHREYRPARLMVTENGAAYDDAPGPTGAVDDPARIAYLHRHLLAAHAAVEAGVPLGGYFVWSLLDNFEWSEGYSKRFGVVHVDFQTQRRIPKASAGWYRDVVAAGGPTRQGAGHDVGALPPSSA